MDETGDANRTLVWVTHRTTGRGGHTTIGSIWTHSLSHRTAGKHRAGGRPAVNRIPEETVAHRDSRWDIPRKRALLTSDGPDSTTSGSDIPESYADRPPEVEYSERPISRQLRDEGGTEGRGSPTMELEMAVIRLQKDFYDCCTKFELARKHTAAVALRPPRVCGKVTVTWKWSHG